MAKKTNKNYKGSIKKVNNNKEKNTSMTNSEAFTSKTNSKKTYKNWKETSKSWDTWEQKKKKEEEEYRKQFPLQSDDTPQNEFFNTIVKMSQKNLKEFCEKELKKRGYQDIKNKNGFLYAKGEHPVLLVAHMDTVHTENVKEIYYNKGKVYSPQGIGGDDRCGIYMILNIVNELKCHVLFTEDEEIGCIGANKFTKISQYKNLPVNYIVEFDRKGDNDAVFYECDNEEFTEFVTEDGFFKENWGSCSDISYVAPYMGVAAVNLSCGYHEAHTLKEYVVLDEMEKVIVEAKKMIAKEVEKPFEYIEMQYVSNYKYGSSSRGYYDYYDDWDYYGYNGYAKTPQEIDEGDIAYDEDEYGNLYMLQDRVCEAERVFHIIFYDKKEDVDKVAEVFAVTEYEAIGMFLDKFVEYTRQDIYEVKRFN